MLVLGWQLPGVLAAAPQADEADAFAPNAFLSVDAQGRVTVYAKHVEMGQGAYTGLATLVADELDADWAQVRVEGAPADTARYKNLAMGIQGTGGSTAMANSFKQMREAGAAARAMLVGAAARAWKVDPATITVRAGVVRHAASGRQAGFGELAGPRRRSPCPRRSGSSRPRSSP